MEMGLGKTAVTLSEFINLYREGKVSTLLVVCPNALKGVWREQAETWGAPVACGVWPDFDTLRSLAVRNKPLMVVMNYEAIITNKGSSYFQQVLKQRKTMLVLDESIQIKNHKARRTRMVLGYKDEAVVRRALSGKPMVQGPHDLWAQLTFIGAIKSFNYFAFRNRFCKMGGYLGKQVVGAQNEADLHRLVHSSGFVAKKKDWIDLPEKIFTIQEAELTAIQKKHYKEMQDELFTIVNQSEVAVEMVISAMIKMQQISSGFIIHENKAIDLEGPNPKINLVLEIMEQVEGRVLIFVFFRHSAIKLSNALADAGYPCAMLVGGVSQEFIDGQKRRFNEGNAKVLVCQVQSAKYGHTLLGPANDPCSTTIFYENSYSLDDRSQAEDRNHRIGAKRNVVYIDLCCSPVERKAINALQKKEDVAKVIIDGYKR
jgi:SNF2 family DNA or RNA helicase